MKAIKFLIAAMAVSFAMSANAKVFDENYFAVNLNVGSYAPSTAGFGLGVGFQTELLTTNWVTLNWDVLHFQWSAPFNSPGDFDDLSFKTGLRAFSPTFANDHLRAYTNLDMGYVLGLANFDGVTTSHFFGLTYGIGLQLNKKWSLGYSLEFVKNGDVKGKSHYASLAYTF
ncbi:MAG: hypothetical protein IJ219_01005 [Bacteroidaceae bacterium]|nr:hypothetical protein [Bacteroidaceae bacterium]